MSEPYNIIAAPVGKESGNKFGSIFKLKYLFLILGVVVLLEVFFAVKKLQAPLPPLPKPPVPVSAGTMGLISEKTMYKTGDKILVSAEIATGGNPVEGADLILKYNPKMLSVAKEDIKTGKAFPQYPMVSVDSDKGVVLVSGVTGGKSFNGVGVLAEITFTTKSPGKTNLKLDFVKGNTKDSNIVSSGGEDILENIKDLEITIQ